MKKFTPLSILLIVLVALSAFGTAGAQTQRVLAEAQRLTGDRFTIAMRTPRGANVYAVSRPSVAMLNAIDRGLTDLFVIARKHRYYNRLSYSDYSIYIARPDRSQNADGQYSPDVAIGAAQYAGTVFDKGGYIYVAGMIVANNPLAFLIGNHTRDFNRVADVVRYEGEHLVLYHNDRRRYNATRDHSQGGTHPILQ